MNIINKLNVKEKWKKKKTSKNLKFFLRKSSPTRHKNYKQIEFAPCNKSKMANKLLSTNLERFLRRIKFPLTRQ